MFTLAMSKTEAQANSVKQEALRKDQQQIREKKDEYRDYMDWKDKGILHDLKEIFHIENPTLQLLVTIAVVLQNMCKDHVMLGRQEKRRREILIGWFNKNYDMFKPYIPLLVIQDEMGNLSGPRSPVWEKYKKENQESGILKFIENSNPSV